MDGGDSFSRPQHSLFFELMDFTVELSKTFGLSPFSILQQDKDDVIMLINYFVEKGTGEEKKEENKPMKNDGFWDF